MIKTLITVAAAGALALPVAALASAGSDNIVLAQAGGGDTGSSVRQPGDTTTSTGGATGASGLRERFDQLDRNHDGFISRDEARDANELNTRFAELDKNNDGKLSRDEYNAIGSGARGSAGATSGGSSK